MKAVLYSRINSRQVGKAHVFDYDRGKTLCGTRCRGRLTKKRYDAEEMLKRHSAIPVRRGWPNAYKFCCQTCLRLLQDINTRAGLPVPTAEIGHRFPASPLLDELLSEQEAT